MSNQRTILTIVLAAGEGTRMRSSLPKVLHELAGQPLIAHVLAALPVDKGARVAVVVGPDHGAVEKCVGAVRPDAALFKQIERKGTAHAVLCARAALTQGADDVLIAFGDTPLITADTLTRLRAPLAAGAAIAVLGFRPANPKGYGRLMVKDGELTAIREEADASEAERKVDLCNAGVMAFAGASALGILERIGNANAKGEFYLTDAIEIARRDGLRAVVVETDEDEVRGINTKAQLAEAESVIQTRLRQRAMEAGVTMIAPETVFLSTDTQLGKDVVVEPFVVFGAGVSVADGAIIHAFSHLVQAEVGAGASVGPYARLRPGTELGAGARIGNFVEVKAARIAAGAKVNHLTYLGDADVGEGANIGAGTITCNYDGYSKYRTQIGAGAFVGSNSSLVAPVAIGPGAYIGSGSVITQDVPPDALAVARGKQSNKDGWAKSFRDAKVSTKPDK